MTRSSEDNMNAVAGEVNQMDTSYGKNFKILLPNDQIKGNYSQAHFSSRLRYKNISSQSFRQSCVTRTQTEVTSNSMQIG